MTKQEDARRKSRRDLLLILLLLPFGVLFMFIFGQAAIRLAPTWMLPVNMFSMLDPDAGFAGLENPLFIEPLNPGILTPFIWEKNFLTPGAQVSQADDGTDEPLAPDRTPQPPPVINTPDDNPPPQPPAATATPIGGVVVPTNVAQQIADLAITKTDSSNTYTPGTAISYTIVVTNNGPDSAPSFNIEDTIPAVITGISVNCTPAVSCGVNRSTGNTLNFTDASLIQSQSDQLTITVSGTVNSGATGNLSNTATITFPPRPHFIDTIGSNNTITDVDTQLSIYDVAITKSDVLTTYTAANTQFNYVVEVTNSGPSDAIGITINDSIPAGIASWNWVCSTVNNASGCNGVTGSGSNFTDTVTIRSGGNIIYSVTANLTTLVPPQNPWVISNTASLIIPGGPGVISEQNSSNNTATDTNTPVIDLQITKDDGVAAYTPGGNVIYTVTVTNVSTFDLTGVTVSDTLSPLISSSLWNCGPPPGPPSTATCTASGSGNINDSAVFLPANGGTVTYTIDATVSTFAIGTLENTAMVSPPAGLIDAVPGDNNATDNPPDVSSTGEPEIGGPDTLVYDIPDNGSATFLMSQPIVANNDAAADFVFYELPMGPGIDLDQVIVLISQDGSTWHQVFYWGDATADTNTNVDNVNIPNIAAACPTEVDNCAIASGDLYNGTGISIDVDNSPLSAPIPQGNYYWIMFTEPGLGSTDGTHVDAIQILP